MKREEIESGLAPQCQTSSYAADRFWIQARGHSNVLGCTLEIAAERRSGSVLESSEGYINGRREPQMAPGPLLENLGPISSWKLIAW